MRWLLALCLAASFALTGCSEPDDNAPCEDDSECLAEELCVLEGESTQSVCRLREGEACTRASQCQPGMGCRRGFCGNSGL